MIDQSKKAAVDRAMKLLRIAAPNSGATEPERVSAAVEAAKVIAESDLVVAPREITEKPRRKSDAESHEPWMHKARAASAASAAAWADWAEAARAAGMSDEGFYASTKKSKRKKSPLDGFGGSNWTEIPMRTFALCMNCGQPIFEGEQAWFDASQGFRHYDITCDQSRY